MAQVANLLNLMQLMQAEEYILTQLQALTI